MMFRKRPIVIPVLCVCAFGCGVDSQVGIESEGTAAGSGGASDGAPTADTGPEGADPTDGDPSDGDPSDGDPPGESACGNGTLEAGEQCDDGNTDPGDECSAECTSPIVLEWSNNDGAGVYGAVFDDDGNLYVAGTLASAGPVRQYHADGTRGWTLEASASLAGFGGDVAWHTSGDLIAIGRKQAAPGIDDMVLARFDADDQSIVAQVNMPGPRRNVGPTEFFDRADSVVVDPGGDIYVVGSVATDVGTDLFVSRRDSMGLEVWSDTVTSPLSDTFGGADAALDSEGNLYALGMAIDVGDLTLSSWLRKYGPAGLEQWTENLDIVAWSIAIDADDNIVLGGSNGSFSVHKYDPDFALQWATTPSTPLPEGTAEAIAIDGDGNVYAAGGYHAVGDPYAFARWTAKISPSGEVLWSHAPPPTFDDERVQTIVISSAGSVFVSAWVANYEQAFVSDNLRQLYSQPQ